MKSFATNGAVLQTVYQRVLMVFLVCANFNAFCLVGQQFWMGVYNFGNYYHYKYLGYQICHESQKGLL